MAIIVLSIGIGTPLLKQPLFVSQLCWKLYRQPSVGIVLQSLEADSHFTVVADTARGSGVIGDCFRFNPVVVDSVRETAIALSGGRNLFVRNYVPRLRSDDVRIELARLGVCGYHQHIVLSLQVFDQIVEMIRCQLTDPVDEDCWHRLADIERLEASDGEGEPDEFPLGLTEVVEFGLDALASDDEFELDRKSVV